MCFVLTCRLKDEYQSEHGEEGKRWAMLWPKASPLMWHPDFLWHVTDLSKSEWERSIPLPHEGTSTPGSGQECIILLQGMGGRQITGENNAINYIYIFNLTSSKRTRRHHVVSYSKRHIFNRIKSSNKAKINLRRGHNMFHTVTCKQQMWIFTWWAWRNEETMHSAILII